MMINKLLKRNKRSILFGVIFFFSFSKVFPQVAERAEDISPLMVSEMVPSVLITSISGEKVLLTDLLDQKPSVLLFYRGGWCPYCNAHLAEIGKIEMEIMELGYQVVAISPDSPEKLRISVENDKVNYLLFSDSHGELIEAMGLAFKAPERYFKRLNDYSNAQNPGILPVPALFVVDTNGIILFEYVSPDYKKRISSDLLLGVLKQLNYE